MIFRYFLVYFITSEGQNKDIALLGGIPTLPLILWLSINHKRLPSLVQIHQWDLHQQFVLSWTLACLPLWCVRMQWHLGPCSWFSGCASYCEHTPQDLPLWTSSDSDTLSKTPRTLRLTFSCFQHQLRELTHCNELNNALNNELNNVIHFTYQWF